MAYNTMTREEWLAALADAGTGLENSDSSDQDRAHFILDRLDHENQLMAIRGLLERNKAADKQLEDERREIIASIERSSGPAQEHWEDEHDLTVRAMIYQSAAHSMAALGMIVPMYESMFRHSFHGIAEAFRKAGASLHAHRRDGMRKVDFWDCRFVYSETRKDKWEKDVVAGIMELADAIGLTLPDGLEGLLEALFDYRNRMFHCGFEWPKDECLKFAKEIEARKWEGWFERWERGDEPWMFHMADEFIKYCLEMIDKVLDALDGIARTNCR
jgi:hypothetical protein